MPVPIPILIFAGLGIAAAVAIIFWEQVIEWAQGSLFPWFEEHLPTLAPKVRDAFVVLNKVAMKVRKAAIHAWKQVRPHILKVVEIFERTSDNKYLLRVTSWLRENLEADEVIKRETEQELSIDDLPDDVADAFLRGGREYEFDVTEEQDRQVEEAMELAH